MKPRISTGLLALIAGLLAAPLAHADEGARFPELQSYEAVSSAGVVAADHHYASEAGVAILEAGGNAADAGVLAMLILGMANPFSSGLGGGGFCLYRDAAREETTVLDFREMAPGAAHRDLYIIDGEADYDAARHGGLAIGVPGEPAGLWALHGRFGQLPWEDVVDQARHFAEQGFAVGPTLARHLQAMEPFLEGRPALRALFEHHEEDRLLQEGDLMVRDDLARALTVLRDEGVRPFYVGPIADAIAEAAQADGGVLTSEDMGRYHLIPRQPVSGTFQGYEILSMPPPSSGGIALIQALNIVSHYLDHVGEEELSPESRVHLFVEALKHAFADRAEWLGDADFVDVPVEWLLSPEYAAELAARIDLSGVLPTEAYGTAGAGPDNPGTSHLSVADADGNLLSCTTTLNTRFGSLVYVPEYGIILNNQMADFNIEPGEANLYGLIGNEQNAVAAGKRPLSSMSPTLVLSEDGEPVMTLGASGGPTIISGVYFTLLRALLDDEEPLELISAGRMHHQWTPDVLMVEDESDQVVQALAAIGHELRERPSFTAVQLIWRRGDHWVGVSDPRKGGRPAAQSSNTP